MSDGFRYWPKCPTCGGPLSCVGHEPENAVPAKVYRMTCNEHGHQSKFTIKEILAVQASREKELGT